MDIDCELPQNKIVRKDMSSIGPLTFFANDGVRDVTSDVAQTKSYFETDGNCVCKIQNTHNIASLNIRFK